VGILPAPSYLRPGLRLISFLYVLFLCKFAGTWRHLARGSYDENTGYMTSISKGLGVAFLKK
jgi:hypothetical protein